MLCTGRLSKGCYRTCTYNAGSNRWNLEPHTNSSTLISTYIIICTEYTLDEESRGVSNITGAIYLFTRMPCNNLYFLKVSLIQSFSQPTTEFPTPRPTLGSCEGDPVSLASESQYCCTKYNCNLIYSLLVCFPVPSRRFLSIC